MNVVLVLMDDLGYHDVGCYGSRYYETPAIDALARNGMRFTQAYAACPVCSPTRAALLTGRYPARIGLTDYLVGQRRGRLLPALYLDHLPLEEVTIAECLKEAGYTTASIGKWHLGPEPYYPERQGFDFNVAGCHLGHPPSYFWPYGEGNARVPLRNGAQGEYLTDRLTHEAIHFIRENASRPFFLYLSHYAVHNPQQAKDDWTQHFQRKARTMADDGLPEFMEWRGRQVRIKQNQPVYAGMLAGADEGVGRIMEELHHLGIDQRTVVIFTSDNGGLSTSEGTPTSNYPLAGGKGWLYDGGIRVPLIVRWPGKTRPGSVCGEPVITTDLFPTILHMAGLGLRTDLHRDGCDLTSVLEGGTLRSRRDLFWHYPHYSNQGCTPASAIRSGNYKLIEELEDGRCELYDLASDPGETRDLAEAKPAVVAKLQARLNAWRASVGARMPRQPDL